MSASKIQMTKVTSLLEALSFTDDKLVINPNYRLTGQEWYAEIVKNLFKGNTNDFCRARTIYESVLRSDLDFAFFYRLKDVRKYTDIMVFYWDAFTERLKKHHSTNQSIKREELWNLVQRAINNAESTFKLNKEYYIHQYESKSCFY